MVTKQNNTTMLVLMVIGIFIVGGIFGYGLNYFIENQPQELTCPDFKLSDTDFNKLVALEYEGGFCERLGLESNVLVQDYNGTPYGVPICVAGE